MIHLGNVGHGSPGSAFLRALSRSGGNPTLQDLQGLNNPVTREGFGQVIKGGLHGLQESTAGSRLSGGRIPQFVSEPSSELGLAASLATMIAVPGGGKVRAALTIPKSARNMASGRWAIISSGVDNSAQGGGRKWVDINWENTSSSVSNTSRVWSDGTVGFVSGNSQKVPKILIDSLTKQLVDGV